MDLLLHYVLCENPESCLDWAPVQVQYNWFTHKSDAQRVKENIYLYLNVVFELQRMKEINNRKCSLLLTTKRWIIKSCYLLERLSEIGFFLSARIYFVLYIYFFE